MSRGTWPRCARCGRATYWCERHGCVYARCAKGCTITRNAYHARIIRSPLDPYCRRHDLPFKRIDA